MLRGFALNLEIKYHFPNPFVKGAPRYRGIPGDCQKLLRPECPEGGMCRLLRKAWRSAAARSRAALGAEAEPSGFPEGELAAGQEKPVWTVRVQSNPNLQLFEVANSQTARQKTRERCLGKQKRPEPQEGIQALFAARRHRTVPLPAVER